MNFAPRFLSGGFIIFIVLIFNQYDKLDINMTYKIRRHLALISLQKNLTSVRNYDYFDGNTKWIVAAIILIAVIIYHVTQIDIFWPVNMFASAMIATLLFKRKIPKHDIKQLKVTRNEYLIKMLCVFLGLFIETFFAITLIISFSWFVWLLIGIS